MTVPAELCEALGADDAASALRELDSNGRLTALLPELEAGRGFEQPSAHHYTVLEHNFETVAAVDALLGETDEARTLRAGLPWLDFDGTLEGDVGGFAITSLLRLACLVHDVAKPETATMVEGQLRFPRHGPRGAEMLRERLPALGFGPAETDMVARLVRQHLRPGELVRNHPVTDRAVRRFVGDVDGQVLPLMLLNIADGWAARGPGYTAEHFERHCGFTAYVLARAWAATDPGEDPLVTGEDLMQELDLRSGRLLGAVLTSVRRAQEHGQIHTREEGLALARETFAAMASRPEATTARE